MSSHAQARMRGFLSLNRFSNVSIQKSLDIFSDEEDSVHKYYSIEMVNEPNETGRSLYQQRYIDHPGPLANFGSLRHNLSASIHRKVASLFRMVEEMFHHDSEK